MNIGFETIGNATIIAYDGGHPVLATDPWIQGGAYFGSWGLLHEVPEAQKKAVIEADYLWFSHGHPDHLNPDCLPLFKGKKILLPDHVGARMANDLKRDGYDVTILENRKWISLSPNIKILCLADLGQDSVLLIDIHGRLLVNTNDCGDNGWGYFVARTAKSYQKSFLLSLACYGDADMIHFYNEAGKFIPPAAAKKNPIGPNIQEAMTHLNVRAFIPSSSMHRYQREDSFWANEYTTPLSALGEGFDTAKHQLFPAYIRYCCETDEWTTLNPKELPLAKFSAESFGDSWSDVLEPADIEKIRKYFAAIETLKDSMGFVRFNVGGIETTFDINPKAHQRGVTFSVPRASLMTAIEYEIFEDLLIGNFMKTTLHGDWPAVSLHPHFQGWVCKYADNGRAKTKEQVKDYIAEYQRRYPRLWLKNQEREWKERIRSLVGNNAAAFQAAKGVYQWFRKFGVARF